MGKLNLKAYIGSFYKKNKRSVLFLFTGILVWIVSGIIQNSYEPVIPPIVSLLNYLAYTLVLFGFFGYFVRAERNILSSLTLLVLLVLGLEVVCFFLVGMPDKVNKDFTLIAFEDDHIGKHLGGVPYADSVHRSISIVEGDTVFDVHFSIDEHCKRITPDYDALRKKHALFFGCSIAFGHGLEDNQTLPYYFQEASEEFNAYNYAFTGYGTNHMLARLEYQDLSKQVEEKDGVAFYVFFWDHIYRAIGSMSRYTLWGHDAPYYTMEDDKLVRNKSLKEGRSFVSSFYESVYQTNVVKYFQMDFPSKLQDRHYDLVCEMIKKSEQTYKDQFGNEEFYVLIYPTYSATDDWDFGKFKACLKSRNIKYIDLFKFIEYSPEYSLKGDSHPNANTNKLIGEELLKRLSQ